VTPCLQMPRRTKATTATTLPMASAI
jgi:hypothetical protein